MDDSEGVRDVVSDMLRMAGFVVREAATGAEALRFVSDGPDLVILDVQLPDLDGFEVCRRIKAAPGGAVIPVLHLSGVYRDSADRVRGLDGGADGYLTKPVEEAELLATVRALLRLRRAEADLGASEARRQAAEALAEVAGLLTQSLDPEVVGQRIVDSVRGLFHAPTAALFRLEPEGGDLVALATSGDLGPTGGRPVVLPQGVGVAGLAIERRQPVVSPDALTDARLRLTPEVRARIERAPFRAALAVPLRVHDQAIGALAIGDRVERRCGDEEIRLAQAFADQAALALENARLYAETRARLRETETLLAIGRILAIDLPTEESLRRVTRELVRAFQAHMAGAYFLDPEGQALVPIAGYHVPEPLRETLLEAPFPLARFRFLEEAMVTRKPVWTSDYKADPRCDQTFLPAFRPGALLFAPTVVRDAIVGGLFLVWWTPGRRLTPAELRLVEGVAAQVGLALENADLARQTREKLRETETLLSVGRALSSTLELRPLLRQLLERIASTLGMATVGVWLRDPETGELELGEARGVPPDRLERLRAHRIDPAVSRFHEAGVAGNQVMLSTNVPEDPRIPETLKALAPHHTQLLVPIRAKGRVIGAFLAMGREQDPVCGEREVALLEAIGSQAGVAIEHARLYEETERRRRAAESLAEVGRLLAQSLDPVEVAQRIADSVRALLAAVFAVVFRVEPESEDLVALVVSGDAGRMPPGPSLVFPRGTGLGAVVLRERRPVVTANLLTDPRFYFPPELRERIEQAPYRAALAVPLFVKERVIGVLGIGDREGRRFDEDDIRLLQSFADQAALALENARLYQRAEERGEKLTALSALTRLITSATDSAEVFRAVARAAASLLGAKMARVWVDDPEGHVLRLRGSFGPDPALEARATNHAALPYGTGVVGAVFASRTPAYVLDVQQDPRWLNQRLALEAGLQAYAGLPLIAGADALGVLSILFGDPRPFTPEDRELMELLADQAAIAIQNARLFEEAERRRRRAESLAEMGRVLAQSLDPEEVAQRIADTVRALFGARTFILYRVEPKSGDLVARALSGDMGPRFDRFDRDVVLPRGVGAAGLALCTREPVVSLDIFADARITLTPEVRAWVEPAPYRAVLAVPMLVRDRVIGVLAAGDRPGRIFTAEEIQFAQALADQAAMALDNSRLHAEVTEGRDFLQSVMENSADAIVTTDARGRITYLSAGGAEIFGYAAEEIVGRPAADYYRGGRKEAQAVRQQVKREGRIRNYETAVRAKDGRWVETSVSLSLLRAASGAIGGAVGVIRDVTERRRAEAALRESEVRYRTLVESSIQGICIHRDFVIQFANPAMAQIFGYDDPRDLVGLDARRLVAAQDRARLEGYGVVRLRGEPAPPQYEFQGVRKDGTLIWLECLVALVEWDGRPAILLTCFDVTERKDNAELRNRLLNAVITAQEEERGRIARELHDEMGQSLASLVVGLGSLQLLRTLAATRARARDLRRQGAEALNEVRRLARGLRPAALDDLGLVAAVEHHAAEHARRYGVAVHVKATDLEGRRLPSAVETALYRIVQEALTNVARHAAAAAVTIEAERDPAFVRLTVTDDGRGFDVAATLAARGPVTHVGLHGMRERVAILRGTLAIESAPGRGTRVRAELPLAEESDGADESSPRG